MLLKNERVQRTDEKGWSYMTHELGYKSNGENEVIEE
jgi:hypothetical protein